MSGRVLIMDASGLSGHLAVVGGGSLLWQSRYAIGRGADAGEFFSLLKQAVEQFGPVDLIVAGTGPGGHSTVRAVLAAAEGMSLATGWQVVSVPSVLGWEVPGDTFTAAGPSGKSDCWLLKIENGRVTGHPRVISIEEAGNQNDRSNWFCVVGAISVVAQLTELSPMRLLRAAMQDKGQSRDLQPIYIRPPMITRPRQMGVHDPGSQS